MEIIYFLLIMKPLSRPMGASSPMRGAALFTYFYLSCDDGADFVDWQLIIRL
jgi:hypothetical protein